MFVAKTPTAHGCTVYVLKSHTGSIVCIFPSRPTRRMCDEAYDIYLGNSKQGKGLPDAAFNCSLQAWEVDGDPRKYDYVPIKGGPEKPLRRLPKR